MYTLWNFARLVGSSRGWVEPSRGRRQFPPRRSFFRAELNIHIFRFEYPRASITPKISPNVKQIENFEIVCTALMTTRKVCANGGGSTSKEFNANVFRWELIRDSCVMLTE